MSDPYQVCIMHGTNAIDSEDLIRHIAETLNPGSGPKVFRIDAGLFGFPLPPRLAKKLEQDGQMEELVFMDDTIYVIHAEMP